MGGFPSGVRFCSSWRSYQEEVLENLDSYLLDGAAHIIAPPGSGKTVLGLEIMLRLNKPTLILVPSNTLKEQWMNRFVTLFCNGVDDVNWISDDVKTPSFMTVDTYQGLHAAWRTEEGQREVIAALREKGVAVFILDEAHHLKNEWWKPLFALREALALQFVCLTATPPYDSKSNEWKNYYELAGEINIEIHVPELVGNGELCPHQDFIYLSLPLNSERDQLQALRAKADSGVQWFRENQAFIAALQTHQFWTQPEMCYEDVYEYFDAYVALLTFLSSCGVSLGEQHKAILSGTSLPHVDNKRMAQLVEFFLYEPARHFEQFSRLCYEQVEAYLKNNDMLFKKRVYFEDVKLLAKYLTTSKSKIESVHEIIGLEYDILGDDLRFLVLTDFIHESSGVDALIGVMPIFEALIRVFKKKLNIAVVTGSLTIFPKHIYHLFEAYFVARQMKVPQVVDHDEYYCAVRSKGRQLGVVECMTALLESGVLHGFVGTKALLGEGWDAPSLNTLVLASNIGSFVSSNQMRGRAIRIDQRTPDKTAHIWHLACVDVENETTGGYDMQILDERFNHFIGLDLKDVPSQLVSGIRRMQLPAVFTKESIVRYNGYTAVWVFSRSVLSDRWKAVLQHGTTMYRKVVIPKSEQPSENTFYFSNTLKGMLLSMSIFTICCYIGIGIIRISEDYYKLPGYEWMGWTAAIFLIIGFICLLRFLLFSWWYRDITHDFNRVSVALVKSLKAINAIGATVEVDSEVSKVESIIAIHGTLYEQNLVAQSVSELMQPIQNPRFIFIRKRFAVFRRQTDYHQVPTVFSANKYNAELFMKVWRQEVGRCKLIYTRNPEGHKMLIKARYKSMTTNFDSETYSYSSWE